MTLVSIVFLLSGTAAIAYLFMVDRAVSRKAHERLRGKQGAAPPPQQATTPVAGHSKDRMVDNVLHSFSTTAATWGEWAAESASDSDFLDELERLVRAERKRRGGWTTVAEAQSSSKTHDAAPPPNIPDRSGHETSSTWN